MLENGAPPDKFGVLYRLLNIEFHGFNSRVDVLGLSHIGSCHKLNYFTDGMGPFKNFTGQKKSHFCQHEG